MKTTDALLQGLARKNPPWKSISSGGSRSCWRLFCNLPLTNFSVTLTLHDNPLFSHRENELERHGYR